MGNIADWDYWLDSIQSDGHDLTEWEENFIDNLVQKREEWGERWLLTPRQEEVLERIYNERTH